MTDSRTKKPFEGKRHSPAQRYNTKGKYPRGTYDRRNAKNKKPQPKGIQSQPADTAVQIEAWCADKKNAMAVKEIKGLFKFAAQSGLQVTKQDMEELMNQLCITLPVSTSEMLYYWRLRR